MSGTTTPSAHSEFGASAMKRIRSCPGSVMRSRGLPNEDSEWAREGTMLHDIAANALMVYRGDPGTDYAWGSLAGLTTEQIEVVRRYVDVIREDTEWGTGELWQRFLIEERVGIPDLHHDFWGTNDCTVVRRRRLTVYDLKCGAGVPVPVEEADGGPNSQLCYYMMGAIVRLGGRIGLDNIELPDGVDELEIVVVQPRLGGIKRRMVAVTELHDLAADMVRAAREAERPNAPVKGGEHCRFCLAKRGPDGKPCAGLREAAVSRAKTDFAPADMDADTLDAILREAAVIETWLSAVKEEAKARMKAGETSPDWSLLRGRAGNRVWRNPQEAQEALIEWGIPLDAVAPRKLVSPAEAQRLAKLHQGEEIDLADMVVRKPGAETIARTDPAADFGAAIPTH